MPHGLGRHFHARVVKAKSRILDRGQRSSCAARTSGATILEPIENIGRPRIRAGVSQQAASRR